MIVGNGFAGTTAAEQLRKHDPSCEIVLFGDEPYTLYNRISLPPMLRKQIPEAKVMIRNRAWHDEHRIELHLETKVERIDTEARVVEASGTSYPFDALLLATGGRPNPSGKPGADGAANIFPFQYLDDTRAISEQIDRSKAGVAIGGSFIAYELAEAFSSRGLETHWIMRGPRAVPASRASRGPASSSAVAAIPVISTTGRSQGSQPGVRPSSTQAHAAETAVMAASAARPGQLCLARQASAAPRPASAAIAGARATV